MIIHNHHHQWWDFVTDRFPPSSSRTDSQHGGNKPLGHNDGGINGDHGGGDYGDIDSADDGDYGTASKGDRGDEKEVNED